MKRISLVLLLVVFSILLIDSLFFVVLNVYPEVLLDYLIQNLGTKVLGLVIMGGFITLVTTSMMLLLLFYTELKQIKLKTLNKA